MTTATVFSSPPTIDRKIYERYINPAHLTDAGENNFTEQLTCGRTERRADEAMWR